MAIRRAHKAHKDYLDKNYAKAQKRAKRKGREIPPRDEYYHNYWGYPYMMYGPFVYPVYFTPAYYPCGDPSGAASGQGAQGGCAYGACGQGSGGCGGTGGCGSSGGGVSCDSFKSHGGLIMDEIVLTLLQVRLFRPGVWGRWGRWWMRWWRRMWWKWWRWWRCKSNLQPPLFSKAIFFIIIIEKQC